MPKPSITHVLIAPLLTARLLIARLLITALVTCLPLWSTSAQAAPDPATNKAHQPNIIFIMADDLGYGDLGCYGQQHIRTPHIDQLAADGIRFTQAYAGSCVCAPTRAILMTGLHNGHAVVRDNIPHYHTYLHHEDTTVAEVLNQAGYRCGGIGKWSLGDPATVGRPTNQGFDMWLGYLNQDHAHYYYTEYLNDGDDILNLSGNTETHQHYSHDLMADRALQFIKESQDSPFFLYAAFTVPHFSHRSEDDTRFAVPSDAPYSDLNWTAAEKNYAAMITRLDRDVGRIVDLLNELNLSDNTLIIFTSDNGPLNKAPAKFNSNGPLRGFKSQLFEGGIRVPFVAKWPGHIPAGTVSDQVIAFWDMLPTLAEAASAQPPSMIDGISVLNALRGNSIEQPHEYLYFDYGHCRKRYDQAVRTGNWKGIRLGQEANIQLYDLAQDQAEENDVAARHPEVVSRIEQIMNQAATPSSRYPVGNIYTGKPIWHK
jgi:arylsulfatase A-like enzyme